MIDWELAVTRLETVIREPRANLEIAALLLVIAVLFAVLVFILSYLAVASFRDRSKRKASGAPAAKPEFVVPTRRRRTMLAIALLLFAGAGAVAYFALQDTVGVP